MCDCDFLRYRNWIVWLLMTLFTRCDLLCVQCILVCDVAHEWVPNLFCAIVMCDSNISTLQIASKPIASCDQFHKNARTEPLSHAEQIAPCERTLNQEALRDLSSYQSIENTQGLYQHTSKFKVYEEASASSPLSLSTFN